MTAEIKLTYKKAIKNAAELVKISRSIMKDKTMGERTYNIGIITGMAGFISLTFYEMLLTQKQVKADIEKQIKETE